MAVPGLIYYFYTEIRPTVIFGLRDDYAHAIPFQQVRRPGLSECGVMRAMPSSDYEEWKTSIHAHAYRDPFFQAYWKKDGYVWVCLNCHTPLENQQPTLIKEIPNNRVEQAVEVENPRYDMAYQAEGVTCAACHVRDGKILGPFDDSAAPHPRNTILPFARPRFVIVVTTWSPGLFNFITWGRAARMRNMKASFS